MPQSNYSKIFDLLNELAEEDAPKDLFEFAEEIHGKELESFTIWRPGPEPDSPPIQAYCSPRSIRRLVRFVAALGFIELGDKRSCSLTTYGRNALREDNYNRMLSTHLTLYLRQHAGVSYSEIKDVIASIRRPEVPFFDTIYERLDGTQDLQIGKQRLRMVLYLLERCGMLSSLTRKIYFAPEAQV
jgi:hypothetical protein